jgi:hypothetical protein
MALVVADRVKETSTTTGTGTFSLGGAADGFQTFVAGVGNTNTTYYAIVDSATGDWEVGIGTVTDGSPDTLSRDTVLESSNSDSKVSFGSGNKSVFCTQPAEKAVYLDASGNLSTTINTGEIADNAINAAKLNVSGNGTTAQFLRSDGDGTFSWATPTDTNTTYSTATSSTLGLVKIGYTENGKNYPVELSSGQMFVNVPWVDTDTDTTYSNATTSTAGLMSSTDKSKLNGIESGATGDQTASEILTAIKTVDGSGSGLDADTLDGQQASAFLTSYTETDTLASVTARGATTTNAISTGSITTSGHINLPNDHYVNRQFQMDAVDNNGTVYILLCRNTGNNDVNGTLTMDRTSGLRHACQVDIIVSAGSSAAPIGSLRAHGVAGNGEPSYQLVTVTYSSDSNSYVALKIVNPDNYYETSGAYFTGRIANSGSNTLTPVTSSDVSNESGLTVLSRHSVDGTFEVTGNITVSGTVDGRDVASDGSKLDGIESGATADQTAAEIRALVEAATDSNVFTDADHSKLNGISSGAEVNQNAFSNVAVSGQTTVAADSETDTLTLVAGSNVTLTTNATGDSITIASTDTNTDTNTTYSISAETATGGANLRLTDSGAGTDDVKFAAGSNVSISRTDANTITIASSYTDTNTTYTAGTGLTLDGTEFDVNVSATTQTTAANSVSSTASRTYAVQVDGSDNLVVNVPWVDTDTNTTYTNLSEFTNNVGYLTSVAFTDIAGSAVQTSGESFSDSDTVLMTAAAIEDRYLKTSSVVVPFFKSDGSSDTISLTVDSELPFFKADSSASNISLTT